MGAVEDVRKLLQDVVTPDLKALQERMTASEKRLDAKLKLLMRSWGSPETFWLPRSSRLTLS